MERDNERKRVYIETYGCSSNKAESQIIAGLLSRDGHEIVKSPENSEVIIVNTCSVKSVTVSKILFRINELRQNFPDKSMIVSGCLAITEEEKIRELENVILLKRITKTMKLENILKGKEGEEKREELVCLPKIRDNEVVDIVPICSGCSSMCTFCATKIAKGNIFSFPKEKILSEIESMRKYGAKEFWITGQDVSAYGLDNSEKSMLPELLNDITERIGGKYFIRVGMLNPRHVASIPNELLKAYRSERIFKFLHLPVQSGSDTILEKMNRGHKAEDFIEIVRKFRRHFPEITVWTDIIAGFPQETEEDFELSLRIIEKAKPDFVNVSGFSSHPKTYASKLKQLPTEVRKERTGKMAGIARLIATEKNRKWVGWEGEVLVDEFKREKASYIARNFAYKPIVLKSREKILGRFLSVKIVDSLPNCLIGEIKG